MSWMGRQLIYLLHFVIPTVPLYLRPHGQLLYLFPQTPSSTPEKYREIRVKKPV